MYHVLFIDLDDTLWDTFSNNRESLEEVYTLHNWQRYYASFEAFFDLFYCSSQHLWNKYQHGLIDRDTLIVERFREPLAQGGYYPQDSDILKINNVFFEFTGQKTRLCPGALDVMPYLHSKYKICILSNGFREVQANKINNSGLAPYIDCVVLSEDAGINKPHPKIFEYAYGQISVSKEDTLMIGDSWATDIVGAHNAGIDAIWYNPHKIEQPQDGTRTPRYSIEYLSDLVGLL